MDKYLSTKKEGVKRIRTHLQDAQNRITTMENRKGSDRSFKVKKYVYLKLQPYRQQSAIHKFSQKIAAKYYGPYQVIAKVGKVA